MAYCSIQDLRDLLPKNVTIGDDTVTTPTLQPGGGGNTASIATAQGLIKKATEYIDARLRPIYVCPLNRYKVHEVSLTSNASASATTLAVSDRGPFNYGSLVRISDNNGTELNYVDKLPDESATNIGTIPLKNALGFTYNVADGARISIIEYPDPIPLVCTRLAVSMLYDQVFVAEQEPKESHYGVMMRNMANQDMEQILDGSIRLEGQQFTGSRFARTSVMNTWRSPAVALERADMSKYRE